ncbi:hypothetical protein [Paraflavitalea pollutisoli]|uniref:hypothetical protein n=1 Tax=Paraflavitalea pollutisoli TaxID=3034143 RepID=UPI0023ED24AC|nr:hypothetical protein [Paraflavitalea sp. H1-2-19X]
MDTLQRYRFNTAQGILELACIDIAEPNNGRMLYEVKLSLNDTDVTKKYFGSWSYINMNLSEYTPVSADKKWIYIPNESNHFLINADTLEKVELPTAAFFKANQFTDDYLLVHTSGSIVSRNLRKGKNQTWAQESAHIYFESIKQVSSRRLIAQLNNGKQMVLLLEE